MKGEMLSQQGVRDVGREAQLEVAGGGPQQETRETVRKLFHKEREM